MATIDLLLKLGFRFNPSPEEVVTYYLPRLIAGQQPKDTEGCIHRADVYGATEPRDLAGKYAPVARSSNGDRFFFTGCKRIKGKFSRSAGGGTWVSQSSKDIKNREGIKIGEVKNFRFKKDGKNTDWLMEEYHLCGEEAGDVVEPVVCRIYVSPRAAPDSAARQESAALQPPQEVAPPPDPAAQAAQAPAPPRQVPVITQQKPPLKRPAAPVAQPLCAKNMGGAVSANLVVRQSCVSASAPPPLGPAPPRQVPLKRPATVGEPRCSKKMRGAASAIPVAPQSCVTASAPPPRCVARVEAPPPRHPPIQTSQMDPFKPPTLDPFEPPPAAASVIGGHHTPQPSVPATPEQGLSPAASSSNNPVLDAANIGIDMDELMRYLDNTPLDGVLPSQLFVLPTNDDEDDEFAKLLEDAIQGGGGGKDGNDKPQKVNDKPPRCVRRPPPPAPPSCPVMASPPPHPPILTCPKDAFEPNDDEDEDDFTSMLRHHVLPLPPPIEEEKDVTRCRGPSVFF